MELLPRFTVFTVLVRLTVVWVPELVFAVLVVLFCTSWDTGVRRTLLLSPVLLGLLVPVITVWLGFFSVTALPAVLVVLVFVLLVPFVLFVVLAVLAALVVLLIALLVLFCAAALVRLAVLALP